MREALFLSTLLLGAALSGCTQPRPSNGTDNDTMSDGTANDGTPANRATSVTIASAPRTAASGSEALVCWRVEGSGRVPSVAVHFDTTSHAAESARYTDYEGGASYPGNTTVLNPDGYPLPGRFCTTVPVGDSDLYLRAHVIDDRGGDGILSAEARIRLAQALATVSSVSFTRVPESILRGSPDLVCWRVEGSGTIFSTTLRYDFESHEADGSGPASYPRVNYPENATSPASSGYEIPGTFCTNLRMGPRNLFAIPHAVGTEGEPGRPGLEVEIASSLPEPSSNACTEPLASWSDDVTCTISVSGAGSLEVHVAVPSVRWGWQVTAPPGVRCTRQTGTGNASFSCDVVDETDGNVSLRIGAETTDVALPASVSIALTYTPTASFPPNEVRASSTLCDDVLRHWSESYDCTLVLRSPGTLDVDVTLPTTRWAWSVVAPAGAECLRLSGRGSASFRCDVTPEASGQFVLILGSKTTDAEVPAAFEVQLSFTPAPASGERPQVPSSTNCSTNLGHWSDAYDCSLVVRDPGSLSVTVTLPSVLWGWSVVNPASGGVSCSRTTGDGSASFSCSVVSSANGEFVVLIGAETTDAPVPATATIALAFTAT